MSLRKASVEKSVDSSAENETDFTQKGHIFKCSDETGPTSILVDGIIASMLYAFDINADKKIINETLSRTFGLEELKKSRVRLYQAFNLQDENEKIPEKRNEETLLRDLHEKVTRIHRIHMKGQGRVVVCMPYNFCTPKFVSDAEFIAETTRNSTSTLIMERMDKLEKKVEEKDKAVMDLLKSIDMKMKTPTPSFSYANAAGAGLGLSGFVQGRPQLPSTAGGSAPSTTVRGNFRERTASFKRSRNEIEHAVSNKRKAVEKPVVSGSRTMDSGRRMKSPPVDIFVSGVPRDTKKEDIIADLGDSDIKITDTDIVLMSKGTPAVVSFKISVKAEDLDKTLNPNVWPMRVKVREFIHYKYRYKRQDLRNSSTADTESRIINNPVVGRDGNIYNVLDNDVDI